MTHARCVRLRFINKAVKRQPSYEANLIKLSCLMRQKSYQDAYNLVIDRNNTNAFLLLPLQADGLIKEDDGITRDNVELARYSIKGCASVSS